MALLKDTPTLQSSSSKNYTHPDNVFASHTLVESLLACNTWPEHHPPRTDHLPICTSLATSVSEARHTSQLNFKEANWVLYGKKLEVVLEQLPGR
jgi:hypothetical protein